MTIFNIRTVRGKEKELMEVMKERKAIILGMGETWIKKISIRLFIEIIYW